MKRKPKLSRTTTWDADLQSYLDAKRGADEPCGVFAAGAVEATTGTDLLRKFQRRMKWAREHLVEAVDEVLDQRPVAFARTGDLVMVNGNLGVCNGEVSLFMALHEGLTGAAAVPTLTCEKAWTVG